MWSSRRRGATLRSVARLLPISVALTGCVEHALHERYRPPDYAPAPLPATPGPSEGAIYPGEAPSGSFLFFNRKARGIGDLVTVVVLERTSASSDATTDLDRKSAITAAASSDVGLQNLVVKPATTFLKAAGMDSNSSSSTSNADVNVLSASGQNTYKGNGTTERNGKIDAVVTCRIIDVLPGNVFHVRGRRSLLVNHEEQYLTVEGLVRQEDIDIDNRVASAKLAEAQIGYDGIGVVDDKQRPGLAARIFDWIYPF
ncbi:MAG TPA: flagellar basal body L-ring protein FlgH [Myxococcota bacterium]|jgi:flagellar L-ring protein precursor FlgH|nr:flagellar basal body L-ring protein FlgH [Myxococcota bacterium]